MATQDTRERLLDAAQSLFASNGIEGASLRSITGEAGVNLASIHYHFGSKEALIQAVFARRLEPMNRERLQLLSEAEALKDPLSVESVVRAFVLPPLMLQKESGPEGREFMCLAGRMYSLPPDIQKLIMAEFDEVFTRFTGALARALPHLTGRERLWRFFFMVGTMVMTLVGTDLIHYQSKGQCDPSDVDEAVDQMVTFLAAGLKAPAPVSA